MTSGNGKSVIAGLLKDIALLELEEQLPAVMNLDLGSTRLYLTCARRNDRIEVMGIGYVRKDQDFLTL